MFTATAGVMLPVVLRAISMIRTPSSTPIALEKLYSMAGAKPIERDDPEALSKALVGAPIPGGGRLRPATLPLTWVLPLCW